jgi:glycosyltransferase involved in cell wall biosynthesis
VYERAALGSTAGVALSRRLRVPLVVEWNGSEVWAARHWGGTTRFAATAARAEAVTLRHAYRVVTVSDALVEDLERRGVERNRIVVHPNGVDADRFDPARFTHEERHELRARYGVSDDAVLATFVGTFGYWHGAEVLAAAAHDVPIAFLFVGDGARAAEVRAALADLGDRAHLTGTVDPAEIPLHLAASDILVAPHVPNPDGSRFFGSPTKLFEYMASGRSIVASELDQIADVLAEGAALLVRPGDATDLARGLRLLAGDADLRAKLGESARARVLERYTWRHHVDAILAALR